MVPKKVIVIGSGPAGYSASIYTARAGLSPLLISGSEQGGQLIITTDIENYPGFSKGIQGPELMNEMKLQAERFGTEIIPKDVDSVDFSKSPFKVKVSDDEYESETVIIATGASAKWLGLDSEKNLYGKGVSACATCDGFFFKDKKVTVVGGGDTAMEEAIFLTRFAKEVKVIHRRDELRASEYMQKQAFKNEKIEFVWDSVIEEIMDPSQGKVTGVKIRNKKSNELSDISCDGVFIAIGHKPNSGIFAEYIDRDENGYILTAPDRTATNIEGVFAAGDVQDHFYRQAVTAAGSGCMAAIEAERYLSVNS